MSIPSLRARYRLKSNAPRLLAASSDSRLGCASIPFWLAGFWRPFGMRAEKFAPLLANHHLKDQKLLYSCPAAPDLQKAEAGRPTRRARRAARRKGAEGNEPSR